MWKNMYLFSIKKKIKTNNFDCNTHFTYFHIFFQYVFIYFTLLQDHLLICRKSHENNAQIQFNYIFFVFVIFHFMKKKK